MNWGLINEALANLYSYTLIVLRVFVAIYVCRASLSFYVVSRLVWLDALSLRTGLCVSLSVADHTPEWLFSRASRFSRGGSNTSWSRVNKIFDLMISKLGKQKSINCVGLADEGAEYIISRRLRLIQTNVTWSVMIRGEDGLNWRAWKWRESHLVLTVMYSIQNTDTREWYSYMQ